MRLRDEYCSSELPTSVLPIPLFFPYAPSPSSIFLLLSTLLLSLLSCQVLTPAAIKPALLHLMLPQDGMPRAVGVECSP